MTLANSKALAGLTATATPAGDENTSKAVIGTGSTAHTYPTANVIYAMKVTAAATGNVATLAVLTGTGTQTTGSPVIDRSAEDFQGIALPTISKVQCIRIRTGAGNTGTVAVGGSNDSKLPAITLAAGADLLLALPAAGITVGAPATVSFTFTAASDTVTIEVLGKTA
jgi:hypothetical protein